MQNGQVCPVIIAAQANQTYQSSIKFTFDLPQEHFSVYEKTLTLILTLFKTQQPKQGMKIIQFKEKAKQLTGADDISKK